MNDKDVMMKVIGLAAIHGLSQSYIQQRLILGNYRLIFDHEFARALWGDGWAWFTEGTSGDTLPSGNYINWKGHLANMAVAEDPIKYLKENT